MRLLKNVQLIVGDVLQTPADVLISTANPWLNMSGGVNAAIRERDASIQDELRERLNEMGTAAVPAGTVLVTSGGTLPFSHIIHAVAIDPFYDSSVDIVSKTLRAAFRQARALAARTISLPTLATGYGPMTVEQFAVALADVASECSLMDAIYLVVRTEHRAAAIRSVLPASAG